MGTVLLASGLGPVSGFTLTNSEGHSEPVPARISAQPPGITGCKMPKARCSYPPPDAPATRGATSPLVAASIAAHPPKFSFVGRFLEEYARCKAARESMSVQIVFSGEDDLHTFQRGLKLLHPAVPESAWTPVVANLTDDKSLQRAVAVTPFGDPKQLVAAWKKWYGIAHLLDQGAAAPAYGLMLDAELLLYNREDCGPRSAWYNLYERIRRSEATKTFPASRTSKTLVKYSFGSGRPTNGCQYNRDTIITNAEWVMPTGTSCLRRCQDRGCKQVRAQIQKCAWSWWTDVPYVNLTIAARLLGWVTSPAYKFRSAPTEEYSCGALGPGPDPWKRLLRRVHFPPFEHICYQQWCMLQEGFSLRDVTNITGPAKWGSYVEDPVKGSNLTKLLPLWASAETVVASENGDIQSLSAKEPPLLIFHVDHRKDRFNAGKWMKMWESVTEKAA